MPTVNRFRQAEEDILAIAQYIAKENPSAARRWIDGVERTFNLLASQPFMGESVEHIRLGLRRFCEGKYLIFYEAQVDGIGVVRV